MSPESQHELPGIAYVRLPSLCVRALMKAGSIVLLKATTAPHCTWRLQMNVIWTLVGCLVLALILLWVFTGSLEQARLAIRRILMWTLGILGTCLVAVIFFLVGTRLWSSFFHYAQSVWNQSFSSTENNVGAVLGLIIPFAILLSLVICMFIPNNKGNQKE